MADFDDLEKVLRLMWQVKGRFRLSWAAVKTGAPYDPNMTA
jgi:hypothetical protein